ncbi:hypothetical protein BDZ89DRAFT_484468 [Hymenopellis radicata]|nr:hypothetical protein BDZ89DRAFT_484468 [Hymenopellis radicata]
MSDIAPATLLTSLQRVQVFAYVQVASCAVIAYDYVLTFQDEVRLIWAAPWNLGKILFFLTRYPIFAGQFLALYSAHSGEVSDGECTALYMAYAWLLFLGVTVGEVILAVRVFAIWKNTRAVAALVVVATCGSFGGGVAVLVRRKWTAIQLHQVSAHLRGCVPTSNSKNDILLVAFAIVVALELVLFILTCISALGQYHPNTSSFVRTFYADGIMYFLFIFASVMCVVLKSIPIEYETLLLPIQYSLHSLLTARMTLHLREKWPLNPTAISEPAVVESVDMLDGEVQLHLEVQS